VIKILQVIMEILIVGEWRCKRELKLLVILDLWLQLKLCKIKDRVSWAVSL